MPMLHSFFKKNFKASKCATYLKLTIPRIKLLRNRREVQLKQMRHHIAKLLEAGQEATALVKVEHVIREENMMAAQDIIQHFCELIVVQLPIIQSQRECPHDLKEAISSVCFAAPRCADLPELLKVQLLFATKYGKEFVSAATELTPDCGVNRQLIELLSVQAPSVEKKLNLLKEVAVEHKLDWEPTASETFFKMHGDLLNCIGLTQLSCESRLPLHKEKHNECYSACDSAKKEQPNSGSGSGTLEIPEVPMVSVWPSTNVATTSEVVTPPAIIPQEVDLHSSNCSGSVGSIVDKDKPHTSFGQKDSKQFVPFISHSSIPPKSLCDDSTPSLSGTRTEANNLDLQDVLAAAHAAAETAEHAAVAARSAANLAQVHISKLTKKKSEHMPDSSFENPFFADVADKSETKRGHLTKQNTANDSDGGGGINVLELHHASSFSHLSSSFHSSDKLKNDFGSSLLDHSVLDEKSSFHQPKRLASMDNELCFSYSNLFTSQNSNIGSHTF